MADEFQAGVCGGIWWNSPRSSLGLLSPCSAAINMQSFGWLSPPPTGTDHEQSGSVSDELVVFQDIQKSHQTETSDSRGGGVLMDSTLQMMGVGLSSSSSSSSSSSATTPEWKQILLGSGRSESSYHSSMLQEDMDCPQIEKEWRRSMNLKSFSDSTVNEFNQMNQGLNSATSSNNCTVTTSFPMESASYGCPSKLLQTPYDTDSTSQRSPFDNRSINYLSNTNYQTNFNEISPSLANLSTLLRQQQPISPLNLTNSSQLWNSSYFPSTQAQFLASNFEEKPSFPNIIAMYNKELVQDSGSVVKKRSGEPPFKRPRIETPSPLPTFKVRKEKLGDRVTALQQLVSPFGKTNTASVLHEAIEYIKHLHNQVSVLSTPYMKNEPPIHHQQTCEKVRDSEGPKQDLRARGLCLVPMSSTFPVANDTTADFWTSTMFGRTFR
ncbi:hypothetical protein HYC85_018365 [Camellia sinensis]|uniref:BHLH domain-containing protein n=1 Tax=Camellia sinensis TaxID=4442 RepID=A0A7J7GY00_CAMSI|nr:hypothetical protein HYC85_018365 [Camellia sinensis]